jgi:hypothetical protein
MHDRVRPAERVSVVTAGVRGHVPHFGVQSLDRHAWAGDFARLLRGSRSRAFGHAAAVRRPRESLPTRSFGQGSTLARLMGFASVASQPDLALRRVGNNYRRIAGGGGPSALLSIGEQCRLVQVRVTRAWCSWWHVCSSLVCLRRCRRRPWRGRRTRARPSSAGGCTSSRKVPATSRNCPSVRCTSGRPPASPSCTRSRMGRVCR